MDLLSLLRSETLDGTCVSILSPCCFSCDHSYCIEYIGGMRVAEGVHRYYQCCEVSMHAYYRHHEWPGNSENAHLLE